MFVRAAGDPAVVPSRGCTRGRYAENTPALRNVQPARLCTRSYRGTLETDVQELAVVWKQPRENAEKVPVPTYRFDGTAAPDLDMTRHLVR